MPEAVDNREREYYMYKDFSTVKPTELDFYEALKERNDVSSNRRKTFPTILYKILSEEEYSNEITWMPHGRSFKVIDEYQFTNKVIKRCFTHSKYSSFQRQVNGWGFKRITKGEDRNSYYHELFLRGMPHLIKRMSRLTSSCNNRRRIIDPEWEPDFYLMSIDYPLPLIKDKTDKSNDLLPTLPPMINADLSVKNTKAVASTHNLSSEDDFKRATPNQIKSICASKFQYIPPGVTLSKSCEPISQLDKLFEDKLHLSTCSKCQNVPYMQSESNTNLIGSEHHCNQTANVMRCENNFPDESDISDLETGSYILNDDFFTESDTDSINRSKCLNVENYQKESSVVKELNSDLSLMKMLQLGMFEKYAAALSHESSEKLTGETASIS